MSADESWRRINTPWVQQPTVFARSHPRSSSDRAGYSGSTGRYLNGGYESHTCGHLHRTPQAATACAGVLTRRLNLADQA